MLHFLDTLREKLPVFDTVLHLGAGPDFEEYLYKKLPAKKYILLEADPEVAERLRAKVSGSNFQIIECLVAAKECQLAFRRFSLSSLNGVFPLGALQALYPRAREVSTLTLQARSLSGFIDSLHLDPCGKNALILDLPGLESELLEASAEMIASQFDWILVSGAGDYLMEGAKPLSKTLKILQGRYFTLLSHDSTSNPLTPSAILQRNTIALDNDNLKKERNSLLKECESFKHISAERQAILEGLKKDLEASKASGADLEKKRVELAGQVAARTKERDEQTKLASERQSALEAALKERDSLKKTAADRAAHIAELEAQIADQAERQKQIDEQMIRAETQLEMLKEFLQPAFQ